MTPEQENQLFHSIGRIQASQDAILESLHALKVDIHARIDKTDANINALEERIDNRITRMDDRITTLEEKHALSRVKIGALGGSCGLAVAIVVEMLKRGAFN